MALLRPFSLVTPSDPPSSLKLGDSAGQGKRRTLVAPHMKLSLDPSEASLDDLDVDAMETPNDTDSLDNSNGNDNDLEWEGQYGGSDVIAD